jgi:hypothetical protein
VDYSPTTRDADRKDFDLFLVEANLLPETVRQISEFNADLSFLDDAPVTVAESVIDGKGLFLTEPKCGDELICPARLSGRRTQAGRYTNHSATPNATMILLDNGDLNLVALADINAGQEITIDYRRSLALSDLTFNDGYLGLRNKVNQLEQIVEQLPQVKCPVRNIFAPNVYAREMTIPSGVVLTGAVHKTCHLSILSKGQVKVVSDEGVIELTAPATLISQPGAKRAIFAVSEAVWTTIHATTETDVDKLVEELTESTADELLGGAKNKQLLTVAASNQLKG